jgi:alkylated DNA repair dioxygenase AlkB
MMVHFRYVFLREIALLIVLKNSYSLAWSLSSRISPKSQIQKCYAPTDVLHFVNSEALSIEMDPNGEISSLCLLRLSKQLVHKENQSRHEGIGNDWKEEYYRDSTAWKKLSILTANSMKQLATGKGNEFSKHTVSFVEALKSIGVIHRILPKYSSIWDPCRICLLDEVDDVIIRGLMPHQITGLHWAISILHGDENMCPKSLQRAYNKLNIPFRIRVGCMASIPNFNLEALISQVKFQADSIRTSSNVIVTERRKTAWEGDMGVPHFAYSGKSMTTHKWSDIILTARDCLEEKTGIYYDGCLVNLYPDGGSGMRYHSDPDQGVLWDFQTAVVSLGASRRFSFRDIPSEGKYLEQTPHTFVLMHGDVVEMFGDCQTRFQHTVRQAEEKNEEAARGSLVFKRSLRHL